MSQMKVILLEKIGKLGSFGDEVTVKAGYARHYLLPRGQALRATVSNREYFQQKKEQLLQNADQRLAGAKEVAGKIDNIVINFISQASELDHLYGSVGVRNIVEELAKQKVAVNPDQIRLQKPIKTLGVHVVNVYLHADFISEVFANVARNDDEAVKQVEAWKKGDLPLGTSVSKMEKKVAKPATPAKEEASKEEADATKEVKDGKVAEPKKDKDAKKAESAKENDAADLKKDDATDSKETVEVKAEEAKEVN